jgi:hypothetical protein
MRSATREGVGESKQSYRQVTRYGGRGPSPILDIIGPRPRMTVCGTSWSFVSVERLDPSDRFVLGHSRPITVLDGTSFDHFVGGCQECRRHREAEHLCCLEIDD